MKKTFKALSLMGLFAAFVVFGMILFGTAAIPDEMYLADAQKINVSGIYSLKMVRDDAVPVDSEFSVSPSEKEQCYQVDISVLRAIPVKSSKVTVSKRKYVVPSGDVFGIKLYTNGVMVVGMDDVLSETGALNPAQKAGFRVGDIIEAIDGKKVMNSAEVIHALQKNGGKTVKITVRRNGKRDELKFTAAKSKNDGQYKAGLWVRDSTAGVGTITFMDTQTGVFGGLGHAVCDVDTGAVMPIGTGYAVETVISGCYKGDSGSAGELCGLFKDKNIGNLVSNTACGVYGRLYESPKGTKAVPVATPGETVLGKAQIIATVDDLGPQYYDVKIVRIYKNGARNKNMIVEVTDPRLIEKTGGIVQGMSGSPILQNGMLIGAVTHVFVNNPRQGYAIFADTMVRYANGISEENQKKAS